MNPEPPSPAPPELEARITALLLGELAPADAAQLRETIAADPALRLLHDQLHQTIGFVREAVGHPADSGALAGGAPRLSEERRQKLLEQFKVVAPAELAPPRRRTLPWFVPMSAAAALVLLAASTFFASPFAGAKTKGMGGLGGARGERGAQWYFFKAAEPNAAAARREQLSEVREETRQQVLRQPANEFAAKLEGAAAAVPPTAGAQSARDSTALSAPAASVYLPQPAETEAQPSASTWEDNANVTVAVPPIDPTTGLPVERARKQLAAKDGAGATEAGEPGGTARPMMDIRMLMRYGLLPKGTQLQPEPGRASEPTGGRQAGDAVVRKKLAEPPAVAVVPPTPMAVVPVSPRTEPAPSRSFRRESAAASEGKLAAHPEAEDGRPQTELGRALAEGVSGGGGGFGGGGGAPLNRGFAKYGAAGYGRSVAPTPTPSADRGALVAGSEFMGSALKPESSAAGAMPVNQPEPVGVATADATVPFAVPTQGYAAITRSETPAIRGFAVDVLSRSAAPADKKVPNLGEVPVLGRLFDTQTAASSDKASAATPAQPPVTLGFSENRNGGGAPAGAIPPLTPSTSAVTQPPADGPPAEAALGLKVKEHFGDFFAEPNLAAVAAGKPATATPAPGRSQEVAVAKMRAQLQPTAEVDSAGRPAAPPQLGEAREREQLAQTVANGLASAATVTNALNSTPLSVAAGVALADQDAVVTHALPALPAPAPAPEPQPEVATSDNSFSTFSLNVTDVSFKLAAASLENGALPEPANVRSEEFINAFDYRDAEPAAGAPIAFAWERAQYPFAQNRDVVRFAVKTAARGREAARPLNLVLLLDNSGSMERADRVLIIREALAVLAQQLQPQDRISVVAFARTPRLWIDALPGSQAGELVERVGNLTPEGGTNLEDALNLAYATALRHFLTQGVNRVVLLTDGAANLGDVRPESLKQKVEAHRRRGVALDCFGIGWEGYNDDLLEVLARNGDGRYGFVNTPEDAASELAGQLAGALQVAAADVKVQVEFNPRRVTGWRQIGYAKHQLTKEQFRDNTVDAAELGAAESGNALYVLEVAPQGDGDLGVVRVRYREPATGQYREREWSLPYTGPAVALAQASPALRLAVDASAFSEWLAGSPFAGDVTPDRLLANLRGVPEAFAPDSRPQRLEWMVRQAKSISGK